jgi:hypothetical protein
MMIQIGTSRTRAFAIVALMSLLAITPLRAQDATFSVTTAAVVSDMSGRLLPGAEGRVAPRMVLVANRGAVSVPSAEVAAAQPEHHRSWVRYPLLGAAVGGVGLQLYYLHSCRADNDDGCMGGVSPFGLGVVAGATIGAAVELIRRAVEAR